MRVKSSSSSSLFTPSSSSLPSYSKTSVQGQFAGIHSSSPFIIPTITNEKFCNKYKLGKHILDMLNKLHFTVGCNLDLVTEEKIQEAGFKTLS